MNTALGVMGQFGSLRRCTCPFEVSPFKKNAILSPSRRFYVLDRLVPVFCGSNGGKFARDCEVLKKLFQCGDDL